MKGQCRHRCISQHCAKTDCKDIPFFYLWHIAIFLVIFSTRIIQMGNNQSRSPLWNIILFSCLVYLRSYEITIYFWLGSFQSAFCCKIAWNYVFEATNCRSIILISFCQRNSCKHNLFPNRYLILSHNGALSNEE